MKNKVLKSMLNFPIWGVFNHGIVVIPSLSCSRRGARLWADEYLYSPDDYEIKKLRLSLWEKIK